MQDQIDTLRQFVQMMANCFPHAALDAIALMGFAQYLTGGEANPRRFANNGQQSTLGR